MVLAGDVLVEPPVTTPAPGHGDGERTEPPPRHDPSRTAAAAIGAIAAIVALTAGELVAAVAGSQVSLVTAVGNQFIDSMAGSLKDLAVSLFGTHDKQALIVGIVTVSIVIAAALGVVSRRWRIACPIGLVGFGVTGAVLLARDPLGTAGTAIVSGIVAVAVGIATFVGMWRLATPTEGDVRAATPTTTEPSEPPARIAGFDRRRFVVAGGGLIALSGVGLLSARRIRASDSVDSARRSTVLPRPKRTVDVPATQSFDVPGLTPYVVPNRDFYRIDTALIVPQIDAGNWQLDIGGMVDRPFSIGYADLLDMDSIELPVTIQCVSNAVGGDLVGNAVWQGVPLADLLDRASVQDGAEQVFTQSVDGFTAGFPLSDGLDGRTAIVAYAMNGEPLPAAHGYPARLIVAGLYGYVSATKWVQSIELTTWDGVDGYWIPRGWSKLGPIKTASRIDVPNSSIPAGHQPIAGVAWAPDRGIERVEVQVDDGDWQECQLGRSSSDDTWVQWWYDWDATPGRHRLRVRATDKNGDTQTEEQQPPAPDGATGWHTRDVTVTS